jgi:mRNA interferase HigB
LRVISKKILRDFWKAHADSEQQLKSWFQETSKAEWKSPNDLKLEYPNASILANNRVVFNIKGNNYRLVVRINYSYQMVWIRFIGTHGEYDKINANEI